MRIINVSKKRGISPVIATVILIAITLIAAIAIAGFVFGLFGSFTSSAQVIATAAIPGGGTTSTFAASCQTSVPSSGGYITLVNSGTGSTAPDLVTLTFGGNTTTTVPVAGLQACSIGASGSASATLYIVLSGLKMGASGTAYTGSVTLTNGGSPPFSGVFE